MTGYSELNVPESEIKKTIFEHPEFVAYSKDLEKVFAKWEKKHVPDLKGISTDDSARVVIGPLADSMLKVYAGKQLIDEYDVYQHLLSYWLETMKDDTYIIIEDGWKADVREADKKKADATMKVGNKHYICELLPKDLLIKKFFESDQEELQQLEVEKESKAGELEELVEEHGGDDGLLAEVTGDNGKVSKTSVTKRVREIKREKDPDDADELAILEQYLDLSEEETASR